jgi:hypothetical protein
MWLRVRRFEKCGVEFDSEAESGPGFALLGIAAAHSLIRSLCFRFLFEFLRFQ